VNHVVLRRRGRRARRNEQVRDNARVDVVRSGSCRRLGFLLIVALACDNGGTTPDWSRMITQPKLLPFGDTAMRQPPRGSVARDWHAPSPETAAIPVPITRALLERGRDRFAIACAACHGVTGDGDSPVAHAMQRRRPPAFADPRLVALTPGKLFAIIREGYGFMPAYAGLLDEADRWAVVAYVRTLQLADGAQLAGQP
jgi:mono/diheme cytochrome c family protein